ncbi:LLM class flavin-dependent oxidoreductase [soil metagenome]
MSTASKTPREIKLGLFPQDVGHHIASWRHPDAPPMGLTSIDFYRSMAQTAERAKLDMVFFGDQMAGQYPEDETMGRTSRMLRMEPTTVLAALSAVTTHIGLIATVSTSYFEPYHVARKFATLDQISGGRSGWNVVTSFNEYEAKNFNRGEVLAPAVRYQKAHEFLEATNALWDSWDDDAFIVDKAGGQFFELDRLHVANHRGDYFSTRGPLNVPRSPQGRPVVVQAGSSDEGRDFASRFSEVVFTAQPNLQASQAFYADVKARAVAHGRSPDDLKIMPGVMPIIGSSLQEAQDKFQELQALIDPKVGWMLLTRHLNGLDLSAYPLDALVEDLPLQEVVHTRQRLLLDMARRDHMTVRKLYERATGSRGHSLLLGTAEQIADQLEEWFVERGADGFNVMPPLMPSCVVDFVTQVVPLLQRRGLFRTEYAGRTLRENLGLSYPANQFKKA